uniref:Uncharacterized protein n=1 Tax=Panagrolaimus davidi TaxID=227884 RepID=A0A914QJA1_9BILA
MDSLNTLYEEFESLKQQCQLLVIDIRESHAKISHTFSYSPEWQEAVNVFEAQKETFKTVQAELNLKAAKITAVINKDKKCLQEWLAEFEEEESNGSPSKQTISVATSVETPTALTTPKTQDKNVDEILAETEDEIVTESDNVIL